MFEKKKERKKEESSASLTLLGRTQAVDTCISLDSYLADGGSPCVAVPSDADKAGSLFLSFWPSGANSYHEIFPTHMKDTHMEHTHEGLVCMCSEHYALNQ